MTHNIYDDDAFYAGYSQLPRSIEGLAGAPEWPTVRALLPNLHGARVLDLGCGFGAFDRWAVEQGATEVVGIDVSEKMLSRARDLSQSNAIDYRVGDLANFDVPEIDFDLIYSALAFHYVEDLRRLCSDVRAKLKNGGCLVATVEHPIFSAPRVDSWHELKDGSMVWPLDGYLREGRRSRSWFTDGVLKFHRTVDTYVNSLLDSGFQISRLIEWGPDATQVAEHPEWANEVERPMFLILAAKAA